MQEQGMHQDFESMDLKQQTMNIEKQDELPYFFLNQSTLIS